MSENHQEPDSYPRDMISIVCPCCGQMVPIELILNAGSLNEYLQIVGINEGGYTDRDAGKNWPVVALEVKVNERRFLDDKLSSLLRKYEDKAVEEKKYEDARVKLAPEL